MATITVNGSDVHDIKRSIGVRDDDSFIKVRVLKEYEEKDYRRGKCTAVSFVVTIEGQPVPIKENTVDGVLSYITPFMMSHQEELGK